MSPKTPKSYIIFELPVPSSQVNFFKIVVCFVLVKCLKSVLCLTQAEEI